LASAAIDVDAWRDFSSLVSRLTEGQALGVVALCAGTKIHYDADGLSVTNAVGANDYLFR
jgi:hypothetical protein